MSTTRTFLWLDTHAVSAATAGQFPAGAEYDTVIAGAGLTGQATAVAAALATHLATGWVTVGLRPLPETPPAEGQGIIGHQNRKPVAASTV